MGLGAQQGAADGAWELQAKMVYKDKDGVQRRRWCTKAKMVYKGIDGVQRQKMVYKGVRGVHQGLTVQRTLAGRALREIAHAWGTLYGRYSS